MNTLVYIFGILLQLAAGLIALLQVRRAPRRLPWMLIALSSLLIVVRRAATLEFYVKSGRGLAAAEILTLIITLLFFLGVVLMSRMFRDFVSGHKALERSEEKFRNLFETMAQGVIYQDQKGKIISANPAAVKILGLSQDQMKGLTSIDPRWKAIHEDGTDFPGESHPTMVALQTGKETRNVMGVFNPIENKTVWIDICAIPQYRRNALSPYQVYATFTDITEPKRMEEERMIVSKLESAGILAGGLAHDFNNLLGIIIGNLDLVRNFSLTEEEKNKILEAVWTAAIEAGGLTQQLITLSKGGDPIRKSVTLAPLLHDQVALALRGSPVTPEFSIPVGLWPVEADDGQIGQVIRNMVINALEAMPKGGTISVGAHNSVLTTSLELPVDPGEYVQISITDQGTGIPEDVLPKIFDPYFSTKQRGTEKGMGLGLTLCHFIIKKHGGFIKAETRLGKGTTFHVVLPAFREK
jgi:two-component system, cell cycle sensor histidine kinase and response regulator CckA